jgi:hypothetical protein
MIQSINIQFRTIGLDYAPKIFVAAGIGVLILGAYIAKIAAQTRVRHASDYEQ